MDRISRRDFIAGAGTAVGVAAAAGGLAGVLAQRGAGFATRPRRRTAITPSSCPVDTIVCVMMENRSFDHMFGRVPGVRGLKRSMSNPDANGNPVYVHNDREFVCTFGDLNHSRESSLAQWHNGKMDGFAKDTGTQTMGYLDATDAPWMYAAATNYTVFDRWHSSILGPTFPNREYFHAGTSNGRVANGFSPGQLGFVERTVWDQLDGAGVPWKQYFTDVPFGALYLGVTLKHLDRFQPVANFYGDAAAGKLAPVSVVEPGLLTGGDMHPPASIQPGQRFLADVVAACMHSPQWPRIAIIVKFDEHGGFFDHMPPPTLPDDLPALGAPAGVRVPAMLISPWAPAQQVAPRVHDHTSATKFIQWRFGLPSLTKRNAAAENLEYAFDWTKMRTDVPNLPVPEVNNNLSLTCFATHLLDDKTWNLPGGEGPEPQSLWGNANAAPNAAPATASALAAPRLPSTAAAAAVQTQTQTVTQPATSPQPELDQALNAGALPSQLDLRPKPGRPTPDPFLNRQSIAGKPAWKG